MLVIEFDNYVVWKWKPIKWLVSKFPCASRPGDSSFNEHFADIGDKPWNVIPLWSTNFTEYVQPVDNKLEFRRITEADDLTVF